MMACFNITSLENFYEQVCDLTKYPGGGFHAEVWKSTHTHPRIIHRYFEFKTMERQIDQYVGAQHSYTKERSTETTLHNLKCCFFRFLGY